MSEPDPPPRSPPVASSSGHQRVRSNDLPIGARTATTPQSQPQSVPGGNIYATNAILLASAHQTSLSSHATTSSNSSYTISTPSPPPTSTSSITPSISTTPSTQPIINVARPLTMPHHTNVPTAMSVGGIENVLPTSYHIRRSSNSSITPPQNPSTIASPIIAGVKRDSPGSQSHSSSRLRRIQQHLSKLAAEEAHPDKLLSTPNSSISVHSSASGDPTPTPAVPLFHASSPSPVNPMPSTTSSHPQPTHAPAHAASSTHDSYPTRTHSSGEGLDSRSSDSDRNKAALLSMYAPKQQVKHSPSESISSSFLSRTSGTESPAPTVAALPPFPSAVQSTSNVTLTITPPPAGPPTKTSANTSTPPTDPSLTPTTKPIMKVSTNSVKRFIIIFCAVALTLVAVAAGLCIYEIRKINSTLHEFHSSEQISNVTSALFESLLNGETGTRGYQITGDLNYLEPYNQSLAETPAYIDYLTNIYTQDQQPVILSTLNLLIANLSATWNKTIEHRATPVIGFDLSKNDTETGVGKMTMDAIRAQIFMLRSMEETQVTDLYNSSQTSITVLTIIISVALALLALTICSFAGVGWDLENTGVRKHNEQLAVLLTKAEEATKLKSIFLANMSHEIRTPMNGVLSMTRYLCAMPELNNEQQEILDTVLTSAESMMRLIDDLLLFSKMEAGRFRLCPRNFKLMSELLKPLDEMFSIRCATKGGVVVKRAAQPQLPPSGDAPATNPPPTIESSAQLPEPPVKWSMQVDENIPHKIFADSDRLRQILTNLCDNAVKFTQSGSVKLVVELVNPHSTRRSGQPRSSPIPTPPTEQRSIGKLGSLARALQGLKSKPENSSDEFKQSSHQPAHSPAHSPSMSPRQLGRVGTTNDPAFLSPNLPADSYRSFSSRVADEKPVNQSPSFFQRILGSSAPKLSLQKPSRTPSHNIDPSPVGSPDIPMRRLGLGDTMKKSTSQLFTTEPLLKQTKSQEGRAREPVVVPEGRPTQFVYLRFSVTDTGIGIDPSVHKSIFEPFQQADMSTTRIYGGTGLGLSICSQLVSQMGGRLKLQSELGKGATFYFSIKCPIVIDTTEEDEFDEEVDEDEAQKEGSHETGSTDMDMLHIRQGSNQSSNHSDEDLRITFHEASPPNQQPLQRESSFDVHLSVMDSSSTDGQFLHSSLTNIKSSDILIYDSHRQDQLPSHTPQPSPPDVSPASSIESSPSQVLIHQPSVSTPPEPATTSPKSRSRSSLPLSERRHARATDDSQLATASHQLQIQPPIVSSAVNAPSFASSQPTSSPPILTPGLSETELPTPTMAASVRSARRTTAPITSRDLTEQFAGSSSTSGSPPTKDSVPSMHILIAEDNAINVKVLTKLLTREGHTVSVANNGQEAVEMYRAQPHAYQLIFMDLNMPIMDGLTATTEIRATEKEWNQMVLEPNHPASHVHVPSQVQSAITTPNPSPTAGVPVSSKLHSAYQPPRSGAPRSPLLNPTSSPVVNDLEPLSGVRTPPDHTPPADSPSSASPTSQQLPPATNLPGREVSGSNVLIPPSSNPLAHSLSDQNLAGGSKVAAARKLHIPIIACTASAMDSDADQCRQVGMDDMLTKPVSVVDLKAKLKSVALRWQHAQKQLRAAHRFASNANASSATTTTTGQMNEQPPISRNSSNEGKDVITSQLAGSPASSAVAGPSSTPPH